MALRPLVSCTPTFTDGEATTGTASGYVSITDLALRHLIYGDLILNGAHAKILPPSTMSMENSLKSGSMMPSIPQPLVVEIEETLTFMA